jgi:Tfp pilus assembly protein PilX
MGGEHMTRVKHISAAGEQGFALYLAIGFIVLISILAGSVGTKLNIAAISEARQTDRRAALNDAEAALGLAWQTLAQEFALDDTWPAAASSASDANVTGDRDKCVGSHEAAPNGFFASERASVGDRARRFFVKRDGTSYRLYGCGYDDKGTRAAFALYEVSGSVLTLSRTRRY